MPPSSSPRGKEGMGVQPKEEEGGDSSVVKRRKVAAAAAADVSMELDILDCPLCFHPLRPPVFQCAVGHVICSPCHDNFSDKCHFCSLTTGYNRCYMIEHVVESIKVACSNSSHGCSARMAYYQKEEHEKVCPHAPCFCPDTGCGFSGPILKLMEHFTAKWPYAKAKYNKGFRLRIQQGSTVLLGEDGHMFLVNMTVEPHGGVISVCCVQPHDTESQYKCKLSLDSPDHGYTQISEFQATNTNLHDGLPKECFVFIVPNVLLRTTGAKVAAMVRVTLTPPDHNAQLMAD